MIKNGLKGLSEIRQFNSLYASEFTNKYLR